MKARTKAKIKAVGALLMLLLCVMGIASCGRETSDTDVPGTPNGQPSYSLPFAENGTAKFQIVYGKGATDADKESAQRVSRALEQATGVPFSAREAEPYREELEASYEILIGHTDRPASMLALQALTEEGAYSIGVSGHKIVIVGWDDAACRAAVESFLSLYVEGKTAIDAAAEHHGVWVAPTSTDDGTTPPDAEEEVQRVIYKTVGKIELAMMIYRPTADVGDQTTPVLLLFPGGGWRAADISAFAGYNAEASYLRARGWTIAVAEYRLRSDSSNTDYRHLASECGLSGMISDCMDAARYLVKYADMLGVNEDAICTGGHSAGGHLALMTALGDPEDFTEDSRLTEYDFTIAATAVKSAPTDCAADDMRKSYVPLLFPHGFTAEDLAKCSPIGCVDADMCPVLIGYGTNDQVFTPSRQWEAFGERCEAVGAENYQWIAQNADHSITGNRAIIAAIQAFLMQQVAEIDP